MKPQNLNGMYGIQLGPLHHKMTKALQEQGEFYFQGRELLDAFGIAYDQEEFRKATSNLLSLMKYLKSQQCDLLYVGYKVISSQENTFSFTYQVQSKVHQTQPLLVNECFELQVPLLALLNETAEFFNQAYSRLPIEEIAKIARGE